MKQFKLFKYISILKCLFNIASDDLTWTLLQNTWEKALLWQSYKLTTLNGTTFSFEKNDYSNLGFWQTFSQKWRGKSSMRGETETSKKPHIIGKYSKYIKSRKSNRKEGCSRLPTPGETSQPQGKG